MTLSGLVTTLALFTFNSFDLSIPADFEAPRTEVAEVYVALSIEEIKSMDNQEILERIQESVPWQLEDECSMTITFTGKLEENGTLKETKVFISDSCQNLDSLSKTIKSIASTYLD